MLASLSRAASARLGELVAYMVTHHRWALALLLIPLSAVYELYFSARNSLVQWMRVSPREHETRVQWVQEQVRAWRKLPVRPKMCTARPGVLSMSPRVGLYKSNLHCVDVSLRDIVMVDTERRVVRCEPLVTMSQISATLLPLGWTLEVLPELDALTVGGMVNGVGVESSSHRYGLFQHQCVRFEVVLPDGSVVACSATESPDLFRAIPWSHGTLGFLVSADLRIVPARSHVRLEYFPVRSRADAVRQFAAMSCDPKVDFVEGLAFAPDRYVLMTGTMCDAPEAPGDRARLNEIGRYYKPWFYTHVARYLDDDGPGRGSGGYEFVPLRDYYHRHTRSYFWELNDIIPFGNHPVYRWLFGWLPPPSTSLLKLTRTEELSRLYEEHHVIQDVLVPMSSLEGALALVDYEADVYPLWLCPMRIFPQDRSFIQPAPAGSARLRAACSAALARTASTAGGGGGGKVLAPAPAPALPRPPQPEGADPKYEEMFVDLGAYGVPHSRRFRPRDSVRAIEEFVREVHGFQMLYADCYMTRDEFRQMFDHTEYDRLRQKYGCDEAFPDVYSKTCRAARS